MRSGAGYKSEKRLNLSGFPTVVVTLLVCTACWWIGYYCPIGYPVRSGESASLLWDLVCRNLPAETIYLYVSGFSLLLLGAALLQRFNFLFMISKEKTVLPFLLFLLLNSANPDFYPIRPVSLGIFLLLFAMFELFSSYQNPKTSPMFNMTVYLSAGSLLWPYFLWLIPVFWIGMYQFRILNARTLAASLLGLFTVFWFVLGWCVWKHDYAVILNIFHCLVDFRIVFLQESGLSIWLAPLCVFLLMLALSIHVLFIEQENTIRIRHFLSFLFIFGIIIFILSLLYAPNFADFLCVFSIPVSIILSYFFSGKYGIITFLLYLLLTIVLITSFLISVWNFL
jgi:hypothetical protein